MNYQIAEFVKSAADPSGFLDEARPAVVFAGRSNVGKSSVINCLLRRKNFARVGASPGKTSHVNYFLIDNALWFVDLPGYGYARVSDSERRRWGRLMESFFSRPERVGMGLLIVDARHKPTKDDVTMASLFQGMTCPLVVLANKWDKLKVREREPNLALIRETLSLQESAVLLPFSAEKNTGREELLALVERLV